MIVADVDAADVMNAKAVAAERGAIRVIVSHVNHVNAVMTAAHAIKNEKIVASSAANLRNAARIAVVSATTNNAKRARTVVRARSAAIVARKQRKCLPNLNRM